MAEKDPMKKVTRQYHVHTQCMGMLTQCTGVAVQPGRSGKERHPTMLPNKLCLSDGANAYPTYGPEKDPMKKVTRQSNVCFCLVMGLHPVTRTTILSADTDRMVDGGAGSRLHSQNYHALHDKRAESLCARGADVAHPHDNNPAGLPYGCPAGTNFTGYAWYWSSSPNANNNNNAWIVNFNNGNDNWNNKNNNNRVRLVRSGE